MSLIVAVLTFIHIISAIGYLGGAMTFGLVIGPKLPKLSSTTSNEFFARVGPAFVRFVELFAYMTVVFGVLLLYALTEEDGGNLSLLVSSSGPWGPSLIAGILTGFVAFLIGIVWVTRSSRRLAKYAQDLLSNPGQPPPEMLKLARTLEISSAAGLVLLIVTVLLMVAAATL